MQIARQANRGDSIMMRYVKELAASALILVSIDANAAETITYTYDAQGRLIKVVHAGTVNNNIQTTYTHDTANNRTNVSTTGASQ